MRSRLLIKATLGSKPLRMAAEHGTRLEVVKLPEAKRGFVLLPRHWVVEGSLDWTAISLLGSRLRTIAGHVGGASFSRFRPRFSA